MDWASLMLVRPTASFFRVLAHRNIMPWVCCDVLNNSIIVTPSWKVGI